MKHPNEIPNSSKSSLFLSMLSVKYDLRLRRVFYSVASYGRTALAKRRKMTWLEFNTEVDRGARCSGLMMWSYDVVSCALNS